MAHSNFRIPLQDKRVSFTMLDRYGNTRAIKGIVINNAESESVLVLIQVQAEWIKFKKTEPVDLRQLTEKNMGIDPSEQIAIPWCHVIDWITIVPIIPPGVGLEKD